MVGSVSFGVKKVCGGAGGNTPALLVGGTRRELVRAGLFRPLACLGWDSGRVLRCLPWGGSGGQGTQEAEGLMGEPWEQVLSL